MAELTAGPFPERPVAHPLGFASRRDGLPRAPAAPAGGLHNATLADWIAVVAGALGALMATLDISITNSALPQIQGEIGATGTEGTWISTGYLMSEIVMIPLTAWLTRVFGLRYSCWATRSSSRCSRSCAGFRTACRR